MKHSYVAIPSLLIALYATPAAATCSATSPSSLQGSYPGLRLVTSAALAPALTDVAALTTAESSGRAAGNERARRLEQMQQRVEQYDAQKQARRRPPNLRSGQSLLQSLLQPSQPDPPSIASARAELKAARDGGRTTPGLDREAVAAADNELAASIDRLTRDAASGGSYRMLVDADRLMRDRVADCVAWRGSGGGGLPLSLASLDRFDQAAGPALASAAAGAAPRVRAEIAAAGDSATLQRIRRDYLPTPASAAAMENHGVAQALASREAAVLRGERVASDAEQARRAEIAARSARAEAATKAREDAAERALLARQRAAQGSLRSGGGSRVDAEVSMSGEPSEAQMRTALQGNAGRVSSRFGLADWTKITYFEKLGCEKAQGRIGWQCDFLTRMDGNPAMGLLDAMAGPGTASHGSARFILRANGWDTLSDPVR